ncbi:flagellar hook-length control protein FliK [Xenorhabdus thuongxuanensis]|uniref:Flagellar hook-length control protein n=1 Tax=Xenorhabdus thuongxuanensis TaxID=1873484 RepID=A0A1Q5U476_9GAMM|nr:flagellar hook-length control protein FliK [Xenorhabdus thuongxuanensis]OKP07265.1 flagellar hook-length control protein [Xenorhabdus thuongxuanensis]
MSLTLLPTDLKFTDKGTDKSQPTLNKARIGNHSSQFGQLLDAETVSMRKHTIQADKNSLKEEKSTSDETAESGWSQLAIMSDNNVVKNVVKNEPQIATTPQENSIEFAVLNNEDLLPNKVLSAEIPIQQVGLLNPHTNSAVLPENSPELIDNTSSKNALLQNSSPKFAVLNNEDLLSVEALSAAMPIQLAGLLTPHINSAVLPENSPELMKNSSLENLLLKNEWLDSENSTAITLLDNSAKNNKLTDINLTEQSPKVGEQDKNIQLSAKQEIPLNNKAEGFSSLQSELTPLAGQLKLATNNPATNNKTESGNTLPIETVSGNSKDPNLPQMAIQAAPALTSSAVETASIDSPTVLAPPPLLSAGQHTTGQFQLNSTTTPFTTPFTTPLLNAHLGSEEWQQQLNQHVLFFNRNGLQQAELRLHPQELGALHIRMSVEDNQAQLHFVSAHQNVRAALEAALPGLRHALAENGIQLAQSSVNSDTQGNGQHAYFADNHANNSNSNANSHAETQEPDLAAATGITPAHASAIRVTPQQITPIRGGIDTFA